MFIGSWYFHNVHDVYWDKCVVRAELVMVTGDDRAKDGSRVQCMYDRQLL